MSHYDALARIRAGQRDPKDMGAILAAWGMACALRQEKGYLATSAEMLSKWEAALIAGLASQADCAAAWGGLVYLDAQLALAWPGDVDACAPVAQRLVDDFVKRRHNPVHQQES